MTIPGVVNTQDKLINIIERANIANSTNYHPTILAELNSFLADPQNMAQINFSDTVCNISILAHIHRIAACPQVDLSIIAPALVALYDAGFYRDFPSHKMCFLKAAAIVGDQELVCGLLEKEEIRQEIAQKVTNINYFGLFSCVIKNGKAPLLSKLIEIPSMRTFITNPESSHCVDLLILAIAASYEDIFDILAALKNKQHFLKGNERAFYAAESRFFTKRTPESERIYEKTMRLYGGKVRFIEQTTSNRPLLLSQAAHNACAPTSVNKKRSKVPVITANLSDSTQRKKKK